MIDLPEIIQTTSLLLGLVAVLIFLLIIFADE